MTSSGRVTARVVAIRLSATSRLLVETQKSARSREVALRLIATTRAVTRPLEVTGLIDLFTIADSPAR